jgi:hypothetical protein
MERKAPRSGNRKKGTNTDFGYRHRNTFIHTLHARTTGDSALLDGPASFRGYSETVSPLRRPSWSVIHACRCEEW